MKMYDHFVTTCCWPLYDYLLTIWWVLGDYLVTTWWPLGDHLMYTCWLFGDHFVMIWWLLHQFFLRSSSVLRADHLVIPLAHLYNFAFFPTSKHLFNIAHLLAFWASWYFCQFCHRNRRDKHGLSRGPMVRRLTPRMTCNTIYLT